MIIDLLPILEKCGKIIIGLSGGADSVCLTHMLYKYFGNTKLMCIHINHGLRGEEALSDEEFSKNFSASLGIDFKAVRINVNEISAKTGEGTEECARRLRYEIFNKHASINDFIATAHNADDNAETLLLNLIRGSGLKGMSGIPTIRENIVRPILDLSRAEIENYCKTNGLGFVVDSTNLESQYSRNKVRNIVFPYLKNINDKAIENINRSSKSFLAAFNFISKISDDILSDAKCNYGLKVSVLNQCDDYILSNVIYNFLRENSIFSAEEIHINKILSIIRSNSGAVILPNKVKTLVSQGIFLIEDGYKIEKFTLPTDLAITINKKTLFCEKKVLTDEKINNLLFNNLIDCDKIKGVVTVSSRQDGDKFTPFGRGLTKTVKNLFNERKIPTPFRDSIIILRDEEKIIFIEGFGVCEDCAITDKTSNCFNIIISII